MPQPSKCIRFSFFSFSFFSNISFSFIPHLSFHKDPKINTTSFRNEVLLLRASQRPKTPSFTGFHYYVTMCSCPTFLMLCITQSTHAMTWAFLYPTRAESSNRINLQGESGKGEGSDGAEGGTDLASGTGERWWLNWGSGVSGWLWSLWGLGG